MCMTVGAAVRTLKCNSVIQMVTVIRFRVDGQNRSQTWTRL